MRPGLAHMGGRAEDPAPDPAYLSPHQNQHRPAPPSSGQAQSELWPNPAQLRSSPAAPQPSTSPAQRQPMPPMLPGQHTWVEWEKTQLQLITAQPAQSQPCRAPLSFRPAKLRPSPLQLSPAQSQFSPAQLSSAAAQPSTSSATHAAWPSTHGWKRRRPSSSSCSSQPSPDPAHPQPSRALAKPSPNQLSTAPA